MFIISISKFSSLIFSINMWLCLSLFPSASFLLPDFPSICGYVFNYSHQQASIIFPSIFGYVFHYSHQQAFFVHSYFPSTCGYVFHYSHQQAFFFYIFLLHYFLFSFFYNSMCSYVLLFLQQSFHIDIYHQLFPLLIFQVIMFALLYISCLIFYVISAWFRLLYLSSAFFVMGIICLNIFYYHAKH